MTGDAVGRRERPGGGQISDQEELDYICFHNVNSWAEQGPWGLDSYQMEKKGNIRRGLSKFSWDRNVDRPSVASKARRPGLCILLSHFLLEDKFLFPGIEQEAFPGLKLEDCKVSDQVPLPPVLGSFAPVPGPLRLGLNSDLAQLIFPLISFFLGFHPSFQFLGLFQLLVDADLLVGASLSLCSSKSHNLCVSLHSAWAFQPQIVCGEGWGICNSAT